jgi:hypothetical protein
MNTFMTFAVLLGSVLATPTPNNGNGAESVNGITFQPQDIIVRDVAILGGGSSGTYSAIRLSKDLGKTVIVVEKTGEFRIPHIICVLSSGSWVTPKLQDYSKSEGLMRCNRYASSITDCFLRQPWWSYKYLYRPCYPLSCRLWCRGMARHPNSDQLFRSV